MAALLIAFVQLSFLLRPSYVSALPTALTGKDALFAVSAAKPHPLGDPTPSKQLTVIQSTINQALADLAAGEYSHAVKPFSSTVWVMAPGEEIQILNGTTSQEEFLESIYSTSVTVSITVTKVSIFEPQTSDRGDYLLITPCTFVVNNCQSGKMIILWDQVGSGSQKSKGLGSVYQWSITWIIWNYDSDSSSLNSRKSIIPIPHPTRPTFDWKKIFNSNSIDTSTYITALQSAWTNCLNALAVGDYTTASNLFGTPTILYPPNSPTITIADFADAVLYLEQYVASGYTIGVTVEEVIITNVKYAFSAVSSSSGYYVISRSTYLLLDQSAYLVETGNLIQLWTQGTASWSMQWAIWNADWEGNWAIDMMKKKKISAS